ncbi:chorismate synthase [bacterium]|nr:chorismate synthase [bacterium]
MPGSSFGDYFKITTFGESHGPALGVVIDGVPPLLTIEESDIQTELDRRRPGQSSVTTPRNEADCVEILSGVFEGKTTGAPLALLIRNSNQRSKDYSTIKDVFRPGHADYTFHHKYGIRDYRGGGRSSGRETAARVAAGAIAKKWLRSIGVSIHSYTSAIGTIQGQTVDLDFIERNIVRCADPLAVDSMIALIESARDDGDSVGGVIETIVSGCPIGLGDPVFDKIDARLSYAIMSIGTTKGIEFGDGFESTRRRGSENNDAFEPFGNSVRTVTNHSGGVLGGISSGEDIRFRVAIKPASSISKRQKTVTTSNNSEEIEVHGRHDPCICPRVVPVVESMTAITILDLWLAQQSIVAGRSMADLHSPIGSLH